MYPKQTYRLVVSLLLSPLAALAESDPERCAEISDNEQRLGCYDAVFRTNDVQPTEPDASQIASSPIRARSAEEEFQQSQWFSITPHKPNYIIPASYNASSDFSLYGQEGDLFSDSEVKFQLSLKTRIWPRLWRDSSLWVAYTQQSYWQLYADEDASAPFRETNHEPELMWQIPLNFQLGGFNARVASIALNHQSNGRARPLSRSWNRLTGEIALERGRLVVSAKSWVRIDDPTIDDNPNIEDFMGRIELGAGYKGDRHTFALGLKNNLDSDNRSGVEFNWFFPLAQHLRGYVQIYSGYGENLADMEDYSNRVGIGIALTDWL